MEQSEPTGNNGGKLKVLVILLFILLIATGALSLWQYTEYKKINRQYDTKVVELKTEKTAKDSLLDLLSIYEERLNNIEGERAELALLSSNYEEEIEELKKKINSLRGQLKNANPAEMARLKKQVEEMDLQTRNYENRIKELLEENEELKQYQEELKDGLKTLVVENRTLDDKVKRASEPQYGPVIIETGRMKKKGFTEEVKAKRIEEIRITLNVIENEIVNESSTQDVWIRIIDPNKSIIAKIADNKDLVDKSEIFTIKHTYSFDGKAKKIMLKHVPDANLVKGKYKLEFWAQGIMKQTLNFTLE
jgi:DNA repair exonuclease SbcCD ATPase subunit